MGWKIRSNTLNFLGYYKYWANGMSTRRAHLHEVVTGRYLCVASLLCLFQWRSQKSELKAFHSLSLSSFSPLPSRLITFSPSFSPPSSFTFHPFPFLPLPLPSFHLEGPPNSSKGFCDCESAESSSSRVELSAFSGLKTRSGGNNM